MTLLNGLTALFACFCVVALRAFQQQNVIHRCYKLAVVTSYMLAFADIAIVLSVVSYGWAAALWIGTGGALGVVFAMYVHAKYFQKHLEKVN